MKILLNLIVVVLIGLLSSTYSLNLSPIDYKGSIEIETPKETSTLSLEVENNSTKLFNPESIVITHITQNKEILKSYNNNIFTATIYKGTQVLRDNINDLELVSIAPTDATFEISNDNPMVTTMDISQKKLGLDDGTYKIVFTSNLISDEKSSSISIDVTYDTGGNYVPAATVAPAGTKGLTLYFTTENADTLIPITRYVVEDKSLTRMTIEQLQNGPLNSGLKTVIGDVTNCTYNNGNVVIDIPSSYTQYDNGSTGGLLAYNTFIKSIFAVDRYWPIKSISFTVDRKATNVYFHGIDNLKGLANVEDNYLIYFAYKVEDRYYLFDAKVDLIKAGITDSDTIEMKAQKLFDSYKDMDLTYGRNPIPENIILKNVKAEGNNLILDFDESFLKAYENKDNLKEMMVESLIYSFTSIPNIDGIKITIDSKPLINFVKDKDLSGILTEPEFINPENVQ